MGTGPVEKDVGWLASVVRAAVRVDTKTENSPPTTDDDEVAAFCWMEDADKASDIVDKNALDLVDDKIEND